MKGKIFLVLMSAAVICGSSLFDAKQDAKDAVNKKHDEAKNLLSKIKSDITAEKAKKEDNSLQQTTDTFNKVVQATSEQLEKNVLEVTRTAIAKGKPLQAIDCIENTKLDGTKIIEESKITSKSSIDNVLTNKHKKLDFLESERQLIEKGLQELINQALKKIDGITLGYDSVVADAAKKVESAKKLLNEIEIKVTQPQLTSEYINVRKNIENKYKEITEVLFKRLQKCIA